LPFVEAGDIRLYYETVGAGPRLFFINGTGQDLRVRPNMLDGPLARHFEVLCFDQRGMGQSDKPDGPYSMAQYAADAANLLAALGWDRCYVLGYSFGGMVAQELAIRYPAVVDKLVLCATTPGGAGGSSYPLHELAGLPPEENLRRTIEIHDTRCDAAWQAAHPDKVEKAGTIMRAAEERFGHEPGAAAGRASQLEARRHHDTYDRLDRIQAPTLICGGRYDGSARPESQQVMADRIPNAHLKFFEGGHLFVFEDRGAYDAIIAWLNA